MRRPTLHMRRRGAPRLVRSCLAAQLSEPEQACTDAEVGFLVNAYTTHRSQRH